MGKFFPHMYDSPEPNQSVGGFTYGVVPFLVLPFTLTLLTIGIKDTAPYVWLEYLYQAINFTAMFVIYRSYLRDSWLNVSINVRGVVLTCLAGGFAILCLYAGYVYAAFFELFPKAETVFFGALPMVGIELMMLPGSLLLNGGIPAAVVLLVLGPITTSCLFYATAFAPLSVAGKRFWSYIAVAALVAVPRFVTYFTVWGGHKEVALYLAQLPIHFIACWTYQKTDTIWAPIFTLAGVNLIVCAMLGGLYYCGLIW